MVNENTSVIETQRLILRKFTPEDVNDDRTYMEYWDKYTDHFVEQKI